MSFGSPASDYVETKLDLNRLLVKHPVATYFVRMDNDRLSEEGIRKDDILVVDRSILPQPGQLIVMPNQDTFQMMRFNRRCCENATVWGVVTSVIRKFS